ncbi:hypothetical protein L1987_74590 [Smallanthus sonchifolius]|uniref:Uncharacterized protein n=1 Tax=Smallanthus sonchifolius TaxID=185202 RepID=A0ACB9A2M3_9ASTR|nr:hypothetical protein L1987_74590 [Smallanthus sonchifolius]
MTGFSSLHARLLSPKPYRLSLTLLQSQGNVAENEANDASAVIEIERLYMGKNSSDEEDLNDVPDDDEYDTESLMMLNWSDDYFQVDNSAIKHDGFFVNRGKLERMLVSV